MGHGYLQGPMHKVDNQDDAIARTVEALTQFTGEPPRSWESPGLTETDETLDLLRKHGLEASRFRRGGAAEADDEEPTSGS